MAKRLLNSGNNKVYEVAEMVGFHDQKYFAKIFKKLCGETPAEYRKENG
jgi:two-component system response regulator YesN